MLIFSFICIIIGINLLYRAKFRVSDQRIRDKYYILMFIFITIGVGMRIAQEFLNVDLQLKIWGFIAGGLLIYWGSTRLLAQVHCKHMVSAVCLDVMDHSYTKFRKMYAPKFRYHHKRHTYEIESLKATEKANKFRKGQIYSIFIDEKHPERVIWRKKVDFEDIIKVFLGVVLWVTCIFA